MKVNIAVAQISPERYNIDRNLSKIENFIINIMNEKECDLIVFPELATTGYECWDRFSELAEKPSEAESIKRIGRVAREYGVHIIYGFPEESQEVDGILYDSMVLIDDSGDIRGLYRKTHLFDMEKLVFAPGNEYKVFTTKIGKIGLMICYDTAFPEVARAYALQGANLLCISTNWENPYSYEWDLITATRAYENTVYIAAANRVGKDEKLSFFGHSKIIDPTGRTLAEVKGAREGYACAVIDYNEQRRIRKAWPMIRDRRPETYKILSMMY